MNAPNHVVWILRDADASAESFTRHADARDALEAWWDIRDLWLRLLQSMSPCLVEDGNGRRIEWRMRSGSSVVDGHLDHACRDPERYAWCEGGRRGSLLVGIAWDSASLSMLLASDLTLQRWRDGPTLARELRAFLRIHVANRPSSE